MVTPDVTKPRLLHGVGLLRLSQTPVTVESEEYVVFFRGWLAPVTFASWAEAAAYFKGCNEFSIAKQQRVKSRRGRPKGVRPGELVYRRTLEKTDV